MKKYPVNMAEIGSDQFEASLVDLPDGPKGQGQTALAAYNDLAARVIPVLSDMMLEGTEPDPTEADEESTLMIGLSAPQAIEPKGL